MGGNRPMEPFQGATFSCLREEDLDAVAASVADEIARPSLIVDGSNAVHAVAVSGRDHASARGPQARARLLEIVEAALAGRAAVVVFDDSGAEPHCPSGRVDVVHAPDADEWIVERVAHAPHPAAITVVTSDRELARRVAALGGATERPRAALTSGST